MKRTTSAATFLVAVIMLIFGNPVVIIFGWVLIVLAFGILTLALDKEEER